MREEQTGECPVKDCGSQLKLEADGRIPKHRKCGELYPARPCSGSGELPAPKKAGKGK